MNVLETLIMEYRFSNCSNLIILGEHEALTTLSTSLKNNLQIFSGHLSGSNCPRIKNSVRTQWHNGLES